MVGDEGEALLQILREIGSELRRSRRSAGRAGGASFSPRRGLPRAANLSPREEEFIRTMRLSLADLAGAAGAGSLEQADERMVNAALEGAELVARGQLAMGTLQQLRVLLPSFIFLIMLPIVEQDDALAISRRARDLIEETFGAV